MDNHSISNLKSNLIPQLIILITLSSVLLNFKIEALGGVYLSLLVCVILIPAGVIYNSLKFKTISKLTLIWLVVVVLIAVQSFGLRYSGLSTSVSFFYYPELPFGPTLKLFLFLFSFIYILECLRLGLLDSHRLFKIFFWIIFLSLVRFWLEFSQTVFTFSDDLDLSRPYPSWIGGWNSYAMLLSISFLIIMYDSKFKSYFRYIVMAVIFVTLLSTQSRGGVWFLIFALFFNWLFCSNQEIRKTTGYYLFFIPVIAIFVIVFGDMIYQRFFVSFVNPETYGGHENKILIDYVTSGRTIYWLDAITKLLNGPDYYQYFIGYGTGHYGWEALRDIESEVHSTYVQFIYDFGFVGGLTFLFFMLKALTRRISTGVIEKERLLINGLVIIVLLTAAVQGIVYSTQTGWIVGMMLAIIMAKSVKSKLRY